MCKKTSLLSATHLILTYFNNEKMMLRSNKKMPLKCFYNTVKVSQNGGCG